MHSKKIRYLLTVKIKKVTTPPHINKKTRLSRSSRKKNYKNFVAKINEFQKRQKKITSPNHSKLPQKTGQDGSVVFTIVGYQQQNGHAIPG